MRKAHILLLNFWNCLCFKTLYRAVDVVQPHSTTKVVVIDNRRNDVSELEERKIAPGTFGTKIVDFEIMSRATFKGFLIS